jgi:hypothetical protein
MDPSFLPAGAAHRDYADRFCAKRRKNHRDDVSAKRADRHEAPELCGNDGGGGEELDVQLGEV